MVRMGRLFGVAACAALGLVLIAGSIAAEEKKVVVGTVEVDRDDEGGVTGVAIGTDDGKVKLVLDAKARKLAGDLAGKRAEVSGTMGSDGLLKVSSYKEVKEDPPADEGVGMEL